MSIEGDLALLANTKENLRISLGLSKDVPFSQYVLSTPFPPENLFQNSDGTIADELVLLANTKENLRMSLGLSKDVPFSQYILSTPFTPFHLFIGNEKGFWVDPSDTTTLFQNDIGTIAVVDGDPIGLVLDKSGNDYNLTQTVSSRRPKLLDGGIVFDRVDDSLRADIPPSLSLFHGTLFLATTRGTASYGVGINTINSLTIGSAYNPLGNVVSAVLVGRVLTAGEKASLHVFGVGKGGTEFGVETTFSNAYRGWSYLVEFPLIDTSSGASFERAWQGCTGLTSFPLIDTSSGTVFNYAWQGCTGLTTFPMLDVSNGTDLLGTWQQCSGLTSFPLLDVSNVTSFYQTWLICSGLTSFPLLDVSNGTDFRSTWQQCSGLTSFPELDISNGTNFFQAWQQCSGLTTFPLLDVSSGTNFTSAWRLCTKLTSFPANFFDNCLATNFTSTFTSTNLSQESIDGILVSINSNGTSSGAFNQSGGNAPSIVGQAAIDAMRSRGWTVTTTGGY